MPASNLTRRTFVVGGAALLAGVVAGAGVRPFVVEADVLRPPGALPEGEFMARCIKCARCIDVCPTDVLEPLAGPDAAPQLRQRPLHVLRQVPRGMPHRRYRRG